MLLPTIAVVFTALLLFCSVFREDITLIYNSLNKNAVCSDGSSMSKEVHINLTSPTIADHYDSYDHDLYNSSLPDAIYKCQVAGKTIYISNMSGTVQCQLGPNMKIANTTQSVTAKTTSLGVYKSEPILTEANFLMLFIVLVGAGIICAYVSNTKKLYRGLHKKQADAVSELQEQVATLQKTKDRLDKDLHGVNIELMDTKAQLEDNELAKFTLSGKLAKMEEDLKETCAKMEEFEVCISALQLSESKLQCQNKDIFMQFKEAENMNDSLSKINSEVSTKLNEIKSEVEMKVKINTIISEKLEETKSELKMEVTDKLEAQSRLRSAEAYRAKIQVLLDEEREAKGVLHEKLAEAISEASMWKIKLEGETFSNIEELKTINSKLQRKLKDIDEAYTELQTSYSYLNKTKTRILAELEGLKLDLEKEQKKYQSLEKKKKQVDKQATDWMLKCDSREAELDQSKNLLQMSGTEVVATRSQFENLEEALAASQKEGKHLQSELSNMEKQFDKEGLSLQELDKDNNKLQADNKVLAAALEEAEIELASEEAQLLRMQLELTQVKCETERHFKESNAEAESTRKNLQRQLVALQEALNVEVKAKNEEAKQRKLLEGEITTTQTHAAEVEKVLNDTLKKHRASVGQLNELNTLYEWERKLGEEQREISTMAEKRANNLKLEVDDIATQLEQLQRSYKKCDDEKIDATEHVQELQTSISMLQSAKGNVEQCMAKLQEEYEELEAESKENKHKLRTMTEQKGHLQSEILIDKNKIHALQKTKSYLDLQVKELSSRLDIDVDNATKAAKKDAAKIHAKVSELENEVREEAKFKSDAQRALKKTESQVKELQWQLDVEKSSSHNFQEQINMLKRKMRNICRDKEEEEAVKISLLKKLKQAKTETEEAEETCTILRAQVSKFRKAAMNNSFSDVDDDDEEADQVECGLEYQ